MTTTTTSHAEGSEFVRGLRPFFEYRDLGIKGATDGAFGCLLYTSDAADE